MYPLRTLNLALLVSWTLLLVACGSENGNPEAAGGAGGEATEVLGLAVNSATGCAMDADCDAGRYCFQSRCAYDCKKTSDCEDGETCSPRGQCVIAEDSSTADAKGASFTRSFLSSRSPAKRPLADPDNSAGGAASDSKDEASVTEDAEPALPEFDSSVTVVSTSDTVFQVKSGQAEVVFTLELTGALPKTGLAYTLERSDEKKWDGRVNRAFGDGKRVDIAIPVGKADPALGKDAALVQATISTALGAYRVALQPTQPVGGLYMGLAHVSKFGDTGLPVSFQIVVSPSGASLEEADEAWLALPAATDSLFSPIEAYEGAPAYVAAKLAFDKVVGRWVATTEYEYRLGSESLLAAEPGQILRSMRFEIEPLDGNRIVGSFSDRWTGFYDTRSTNGVVDFADLTFEGDLELERDSAGMTAKELPPAPSLTKPTPTHLDAPVLSQCSSSSQFPTTTVTLGGTDYSCGSITSRTSFELATPDAQAACALAAASHALAGTTTSSALQAFFDDNPDNTGGQSFAEFLEACAKNADSGPCVPTPEILCARQLLSHAFYNQSEDSAAARQLVVSYQDVTGEASLGRQLAAFKTDNDTRMDWLKSTDFPAFVSDKLEDFMSGLLSEWQKGVLDAHLGVLGTYFDPSGLAVMSRTTTGDALDARRRLLSQMVQGWRGAMDSLVVATNRWNELYQDADKREERSTYVRGKMLDLYLAAGILTNLTRDAGSGYQASAFGTGFTELMTSVAKLGRSFDELVFARDAEVVVSTSLDPTSNNETILGELDANATAAIEAASESVQTVLAQADAEALSETELQNRMNNEINELRDGLVDLCGLPDGCTVNDFRGNEQDCVVKVAAGECGFLFKRGSDEYLAFNPDDLSVSEAGRALLTYADSGQAVLLAAEELRAFNAKLSLELETLEALAKNVNDLNELRLQGITDLQTLIEQQGIWEDQGLSDLRNALEAKATERSAQIQKMRSNIKLWNGITVAGATVDFLTQSAITVASTAADSFEVASDFAEDTGEAAAEALPKSVGLANDISAPIRGGIKLSAAAVKNGLKLACIGSKVVSAKLQIALDLQQKLREATLTVLKENASLDEAISEAQLEKIGDKLELKQAETEGELDNLGDAYAVVKAQREAEIEYAKDMSELLTRRNDYKKLLEDRAGLEIRVARAQLGLQRSEAEYLAVVQRAGLSNARLLDLTSQRSDVNQLVGSPSTVFARANRLTQAENRLERAKTALMDWLVALEYYAVRPFVDQRVEILLARNPYQLEEIAASLKSLQSNCGGAVNKDHTELSVRDELLGLTLPVDDEVADTQLPPEERFRSLLREGYVPIDKRVRYTTDETVGDLVKEDGRVLSASFNIGLDNFANLASTCNAKISAINVQLVGAIGEGRPTVTILYDGSSQLRSCQPGITDIVEQIGEDQTSFGKITSLRVPGRSISPVATVNEWNSDEDAEGNISLSGLPLASQYTVLIDTQIGENADFDWTKLEDILLDIQYEYSDLFAEGQCQ